MVVRATSIWTIYTVVLFLGVCVLAKQAVITILEQLDENDTSVTYIFKIWTLLILCTYYFLPIYWFFEWPGITKYSNKWRQFQIMYLDYTGAQMHCNYKKKIIFAMVFAVVGHVFSSTFGTELFNLSSWFDLIPFQLLSFYWAVFWIYWFYISLEIVNVSSQLKDHLSKILKEKEGLELAIRLHTCRLLWLSLSELTQGLGQSLASTFIVLFLLSVADIITGLYMLIYWYSGDVKDPGPLLFAIIGASVMIVTITESAERATEKVGPSFYDYLIRIKTTSMDPKVVYEVKHFLETMKMNPPSVKMAGYFEINRHLCISISSNVLTYLIILVQFSTADQTRAASVSNSTTLTTELPK